MSSKSKYRREFERFIKSAIKAGYVTIRWKTRGLLSANLLDPDWDIKLDFYLIHQDGSQWSGDWQTQELG